MGGGVWRLCKSTPEPSIQDLIHNDRPQRCTIDMDSVTAPQGQYESACREECDRERGGCVGGNETMRYGRLWWPARQVLGPRVRR